MHNKRNIQVELIQINTYRMYLQIVYLSNITSTDGKYFLPDFIKRSGPQYPRSSYRWPIQPFPTTLAWKIQQIWKKIVKQICQLNNNTLPPQFQVNKCIISVWKDKGNTTGIARINTISKYFYKINNHSKIRSNIDSKEKEVKFPNDMTPIIAINNIEFIIQEIINYHPTSPPITNQLRDHILQLPTWQQMLIKTTKNWRQPTIF